LRKQGNYPVIGGALLHLKKTSGILYTIGYMPYYETYPSSHIPHPLEINIKKPMTKLKSNNLFIMFF